MEGDKLESELKSVITDANVLIDYLAADRKILKLIAGIFNEVYIPFDILKEVKQLTEKQATSYGFIVYYPEDDTYFKSANTTNGLSFEDNICIIDSKKNGWGIVTNDSKMRKKCEDEGVEIFWGMQLMILLIKKGSLSKKDAIRNAEKMKLNNTRITEKNLKEFILKINQI